MRALPSVSLGLFAAIASAQDKPAMFRGDARHSGLFDSPTPSALNIKWKLRTGGPVVSSPAVEDGVVYIGSADKNLYAVDAATGAVRWRFATQGDVNSSPAVARGTAYVVSLDGNLYAVDAASGKQRWKFATEGERRVTGRGILYSLPQAETMADPWDLFLSSPAVEGGAVFFGSGDGSIYAVDAVSGKLKWQYRTGDVVHASPAVADGVVYAGSADTWFYALDARDGRLLWKFKTGEDQAARLMTGIPGSAAVAGGTVWFGSRDASFYALDAKTGALRWKLPMNGSWVIASPAVVGHTVYITTSDTRKFVALDGATGGALFTLSYNVYSFSSPSIAGSHAYFGTFDGKLHDVDLTRRAYSAEFVTDSSRQNGPRWLDADGLLNQDAVWTGDTIDDVVLDLKAKVFSMGSILSSPAVAGGVVYAGSVDGYLYALGD